MKYDEMRRKIEAGGCKYRRTAKHPVFYSPITNREFDLPHHKGEVPIGTLKKIEKQSGVKLR